MDDGKMIRGPAYQCRTWNIDIQPMVMHFSLPDICSFPVYATEYPQRAPDETYLD